jgi:hypothetical protein
MPRGRLDFLPLLLLQLKQGHQQEVMQFTKALKIGRCAGVALCMYWGTNLGVFQQNKGLKGGSAGSSRYARNVTRWVGRRERGFGWEKLHVCASV